MHPVLMSRDVAVSVCFYTQLGFHVTFQDDPVQPRYAELAGQPGTTATAPAVVPVAQVATVTVSSTATTLTVDQTAQLTAVAKDSAGNTLTGRAVTWRSADTTMLR